jgi:hypothetical protein
LSMAVRRLPQALDWEKSFFQVSKHFSCVVPASVRDRLTVR